jgi:hypothetical protein
MEGYSGLLGNLYLWHQADGSCKAFTKTAGGMTG